MSIAAQRALETLAVAHVADEVAQLWRLQRLRHLVLLELIARINDDPARLVELENAAHEPLAERAGSAGDENRAIAERGHCTGQFELMRRG